MKLLTVRALFLVKHLNLPAATQVDDAEWEPFQIHHLNDDSTFRIEDKSRQIAWSWTVSAEAVACAVLYGEHTAFVSINLEEAMEKIRYAKRIYEALEISDLPKLKVDNVLKLEFGNGARIVSLPSREPRGKARFNIVLDEFAHVQHDRKIYAAALPVISRGGRMRIGSSPMGAIGTFWEVSRQELKSYTGYTRATTPWWRVAAFCKNGTRPPHGVAESMETLERVERFGSERIQAICDNMPLDDFQQEYECVYVDETVSFFPWELIRANQVSDLKVYHRKDLAGVEQVLPWIKSHTASGAFEPILVGGVDIGRKKHLTEIFFVGVPKAGASTPLRLMVSLDRVEFDVQETILRRILKVLPVAALLIDQNGIGMHLAENLAANTCAQGVDFTNASKQLWASELKIQFERKNVPIPKDRDLAYQIHSIKKRITAAKHNVYDTEANEKHHADKTWALALAVWAAREYQDRPTTSGRIRRDS